MCNLYFCFEEFLLPLKCWWEARGTFFVHCWYFSIKNWKMHCSVADCLVMPGKNLRCKHSPAHRLRRLYFCLKKFDFSLRPILFQLFTVFWIQNNFKHGLYVLQPSPPSHWRWDAYPWSQACCVGSYRRSGLFPACRAVHRMDLWTYKAPTIKDFVRIIFSMQ